MKRPFWVALGIGAGAAGAVLAGRWTRKQAQRVAPRTIAREARDGLFELTKLLNESIAEGKRAMDEREAELRRSYRIDDRRDPPEDPGGGLRDDAGGPTAA